MMFQAQVREGFVALPLFDPGPMEIAVLLAIILGSFTLGCLCAGVLKADMYAMVKAAKVQSMGVRSMEAKRRSISTQSQCTYKRKHVTPRFHALPERAEGVFDISFPDEM